MSDQDSILRSKVLSRILAVTAEGTATALVPLAGAALQAEAFGIGALLIGCWAAAIAVKNEALGKPSTESQKGVEALLATLISEHRSLSEAIEALSADETMHELVSRQRVTVVRDLLRLSSEELKARIDDHQEITFALIRYIEEWSSRSGQQLDQILQSLDAILRIEGALDALPRLEESLAGGVGHIRNDIARLDEKLDNFIRQRVLPVPAASDLVGEDVIADLAQRLYDASGDLLNWPSTVGATQQHIASDAEQTALAALQEASSSILILGAKGTGKSALSAFVCQRAIADGFVVLAIKADKLPADIRTADDLRKDPLKLPIAPREVIRLLAGKRKVLLAVDQLDSVSELVDRSSGRLNVLLNLIRDVSGINNVHVLAACREFDFRHDARLSTIRATELRLEPPPWDSVAKVLTAEGIPPDGLGAPMRELLRIPWNLQMYLKVARPGDTYASMQSLIEAVWRNYVTSSGGPPDRITLVGKIATRMSEREELFVPSVIADEHPAARDALLHDEVIVLESQGRALGFRHQAYYDYALARLFAVGRKSLSQHVLKRQDGLFVRPTMLNGLELVRDTSRSLYHDEITALFAANPRLHIRRLLIEYIAQQQEPDDCEYQLLSPMLNGRDAPLILRAAAGSPGWFDRLRRSGELARWMMRTPDEAALCVGVLLSALRHDSSLVYELVNKHWASQAIYDRHIEVILQNVPQWDDSWTGLACTVVGRSSMLLIWLAAKIAKDNSRAAISIVRTQLERELRDARQRLCDTRPHSEGTVRRSEQNDIRLRRSGNIIEDDVSDRSGLVEIAKCAPDQFLQELWPWFVDALQDNLSYQPCESSYRDDQVTWGHYDLSPIPVVEALHQAADLWAATDPQAFSEFALQAASSEALTAHRVLTRALAVAAPRVPAKVLSYMLGDRRRLAVGTHRSKHKFSETLIRRLFPHLNHDERKQLEEWILSYEIYPPSLVAERTPADRFEFRKWNRQHRLLLLRAIPIELLSEGAKGIRGQEETRFPTVGLRDPDEHEVYTVGARVTADELAKCTIDEMFHLFDVLINDAEGGPHRERHRAIPIERTGGVEFQARELDAFASKQPGRVLAGLHRFSPTRSDHQKYVAAVIAGLARGEVSADTLFGAITVIQRAGFSSDEVRESIASAVETRANKGEVPPRELLDGMAMWLSEMQVPEVDSRDRQAEESDEPRGPLLWRGGSVYFALSPGRARVFDALCRAYIAQQPRNYDAILQLLHSRGGHERHPGVCADMMVHALVLFSDRTMIRGASEAYNGIITSIPETLMEDAAIVTLGEVAGYVQPPALYEGWLVQLQRRPERKSRQGYGELLILYYARSRSAWADDAIGEALSGGDRAILRGLAYGAAQGFEHSHCRERAADILCAVTSTGDAELQKLVEPALVPTEDGSFPLDDHAVRLINTICRYPSAVEQVGARLLDAVAPSAGSMPEFVLRVANVVLDTAGSRVADLSSPLSQAAEALTNIAMTLHRQASFRPEGLAVFERLQELGLQEAAAALELLDRKPFRRHAMPIFRRRARRSDVG